MGASCQVSGEGQGRPPRELCDRQRWPSAGGLALIDAHDVLGVGDSRPQRSVARLVGAVVSAILAGVMMSSAIMGGAVYYYSKENPDENWGLLFWGEHWLLRALASISAANMGLVYCRRHCPEPGR